MNIPLIELLSHPPKLSCGYCERLCRAQADKIKDLTYQNNQLLKQKDEALRVLRNYDALWHDVEAKKREIAELKAKLEQP